MKKWLTLAHLEMLKPLHQENIHKVSDVNDSSRLPQRGVHLDHLVFQGHEEITVQRIYLQSPMPKSLKSLCKKLWLKLSTRLRKTLNPSDSQDLDNLLRPLTPLEWSLMSMTYHMRLIRERDCMILESQAPNGTSPHPDLQHSHSATRHRKDWQTMSTIRSWMKTHHWEQRVQSQGHEPLTLV